MFKISEIKELITLLDSTNVSELELENEGMKLLIKKNNNHNGMVASQAFHTPPLSVPMNKGDGVIPMSFENTIATAEAQAPKEVQTQVVNTKIVEITSPMVGTFYASSSPDAEPYAKVGNRISENDVICIVEAMKLMNEIEAECNGEIVEVCVEDGQLVEYGQTLFKVSKE